MFKVKFAVMKSYLHELVALTIIAKKLMLISTIQNVT